MISKSRKIFQENNQSDLHVGFYTLNPVYHLLRAELIFPQTVSAPFTTNDAILKNKLITQMINNEARKLRGNQCFVVFCSCHWIRPYL